MRVDELIDLMALHGVSAVRPLVAQLRPEQRSEFRDLLTLERLGESGYLDLAPSPPPAPRARPRRHRPRLGEETDSKWYSDRGGAVVRGRVLQQDYFDIAIVQRADGDWEVTFGDPVPTDATPFDDTKLWEFEVSAERRARKLRAYGYVVTVKQKRSGDWYCAVSRVFGPFGLPTATGPDTGREFDAQASATRRAEALAEVGFGTTVNKLSGGLFQVQVTSLPRFDGKAPSSTTTKAPATKAPATKTPTTTGSGTPTTTGAGTPTTTGSGTATTTGSGTSTTTGAGAPPHKLVVINSADPGKGKLSDAVVQSFRDFAADVKAVTDVEIDRDFGDTIRGLGGSTTKTGADTVSWHKTGRTVDVNQSLRWLIIEETVGSDTYFRLYLRHKTLSTAAAPPGIVTFPSGTTFHASWWDKVDASWPFVDVTALAAAHGWQRIPAQSGWSATGSGYNKQEWWHYQRTDGLTWYQALRQIYTEAEVVTGFTSFAVLEKHAARLKREGTPESVLVQVFPAVTKGTLSLHCPVGLETKRSPATGWERGTNLARDVRAVQTALIAHGKLTGTASGTLDAATQLAIDGLTSDGVVDVGGATHRTLGAKP